MHKKRNIHYPAILVSIVFFLTFLLSTVSYAQEGGGLSVRVSPSTIDTVIEPGQSAEGTLTVTNQNGGRQTYFLGTRDITGVNDTGTPSFSTEASVDELNASSWLKPLVKSVTLDVGEAVEIPYRIDVPANASPGSHFAAFFVTREAEETTQSGAGVGFHVASLVNIRVAGDAIEDMLFREFFTFKSFFTKPDVYFTARLDNTGTVHQRPRGIITVKDMLGNEVGQATFNDSNGAVLPYNDRVFETIWSGDSFAIGRYTAIASVIYGETDKKTLTKEVSFWIMPVKEIGIALGVLAFMLIIFIFGVRRYIQNELKKAGHASSTKTNEKKNITFARRLANTALRLTLILVVLLIGVIVFFA